MSVAVIGLGYVGLPLAVALADKRFRVIGIDKSPERINPLRKGQSTVEGIRDTVIKRNINRGHFMPVLVKYSGGNDRDRRMENFPEPDEAAVRQLVGTDVFIACVQTPLLEGRGRQPDLRWVRSALKLIDRVCRLERELGLLPPERLIILESTTYPGTTRKVFLNLVEEYGTDGRQWYLGYSPERTDPGPKAHKLISRGRHRQRSRIPRIVAGLNPESCEVAAQLYQQVFATVVPVSTLETAEMIKLVENTFRFVSIAFANEMGLICKALKINIWEVIKGAKTKGFGLDICYPGLIGGHCIPIDPHYLGTVAREEGLISAFIDSAEQLHQETKRESLDLIQRLLNQRDKGIRGSKILFFGAAYKKNVADVRESPSLDLMKELLSKGAQITYFDPLVEAGIPTLPLKITFNKVERSELPDKVRGLKLDNGDSFYVAIRGLGSKWDEVRAEVLSGQFDCIVISTDHDIFQASYADLLLTASAPPIADLRNAIDSWLSGKNSLSADETQRVQQAISRRSGYMLLCRN